jgi:hypothetical protein
MLRTGFVASVLALLNPVRPARSLKQGATPYPMFCVSQIDGETYVFSPPEDNAYYYYEYVDTCTIVFKSTVQFKVGESYPFQIPLPKG